MRDIPLIVFFRGILLSAWIIPNVCRVGGGGVRPRGKKGGG
jgi:hypothetical protein